MSVFGDRKEFLEKKEEEVFWHIYVESGDRLVVFCTRDEVDVSKPFIEFKQENGLYAKVNTTHIISVVQKNGTYVPKGVMSKAGVERHKNNACPYPNYE